MNFNKTQLFDNKYLPQIDQLCKELKKNQMPFFFRVVKEETDDKLNCFLSAGGFEKRVPDYMQILMAFTGAYLDQESIETTHTMISMASMMNVLPYPCEDFDCTSEMEALRERINQLVNEMVADSLPFGLLIIYKSDDDGTSQQISLNGGGSKDPILHILAYEMDDSLDSVEGHIEMCYHYFSMMERQ